MSEKTESTAEREKGRFAGIRNGFTYLKAAATSPRLVGSLILSAGRSVMAAGSGLLSLVPLTLGRGPLIFPALAMSGALGYYLARPAANLALRGWGKTEQINSDVYRQAVGLPLRPPKLKAKGETNKRFNESSKKDVSGDKEISKEEKLNLLKKLRLKL